MINPTFSTAHSLGNQDAEINAEILALLDEKHRLHKGYFNDSSSSLKKTAFLNIHRVSQQRLSHARHLDACKSRGDSVLC